jgi:hypothetical protein
MLQELEEGTGYIHSGDYGVDMETNPGTFDDWVDREGIRLGVEYGLASKWTSFVAVQKRKKANSEAVRAEEMDGMEVDADADADDYWTDIESVTEVGDAGDYGYLARERSKDKAVAGQTGGGGFASFASPLARASKRTLYVSASPSKKRRSSAAMGLASLAQSQQAAGGVFLQSAQSFAYAPPLPPPAAPYAPSVSLQHAQQTVLFSNDSAQVSDSCCIHNHS